MQAKLTSLNIHENGYRTKYQLTGTVFVLLIALSSLSVSLFNILGARFYEMMLFYSHRLGDRAAEPGKL